MALDMATVVQRIRSDVAAVTGMERVYGWGEPITSTNRIPPAINEWPTALVFPRRSIEVDHYPGGTQRHTYVVGIQVYEYPSGQLGGPPDKDIPALLLTKMAQDSNLGARCNWDRIDRWEYGSLEYPVASEMFHVGWDIDLVVSEEEDVVFAGGTP